MTRMVAWWLSSLILVAVASAWVSAQAMTARPLDTPLMLTGADIGVRVEAWQGDRALGRLMVRVDGRWVELGTSNSPMRLAK